MLSFPDGIGVHVGGIAMINVHYLNATDDALETDVTIKFDTIAADKVTQEGDILFLYNPLISVPPNSTARAQWSCPVYKDIHIANVQSHMHKRGMGYEAKVDNAADFYTNTEWERVPVEDLSIDVKAGSRLEYYCDYRNTESRQIYQGTKTCQETLGCVQGVAGNLQGVTDCVMASEPEVSVELSAALHCFMRAQNPFAECGPQIDACSAK